MGLLLAIDVGNTNIVLGLFDLSQGKDAPVIQSWRISTSRERTPDEYGLASLALLSHRGIEPSQITDVIISSVVPPLHPVLDAWIQSYFNVDPIWIGPGVKTGLRVMLDNPSELGADRIVNCVAGIERFGIPLIVIDFGTATTFDVVNAKREYLGGLILPGLKIGAEALFQRASRLPRVEIAEPERLIGRNTVQAMQSGLFYGYVGQVDGILERLLGEFPEAKVVATGGLAKTIAASSKHIHICDSDLTLEGLRLLWMKNRK
ncbi:MAG: putative transcriptional acitvator, Baf family [Holophagaceae bacterium]|nr:putative transcriptional acitvator, Baf family [Holophagaceae bacterium]